MTLLEVFKQRVAMYAASCIRLVTSSTADTSKAFFSSNPAFAVATDKLFSLGASYGCRWSAQEASRSIEKHYECLNGLLTDVHQTTILEPGTGSGSAVNFLYSDNNYTGIDISPGLLKRAAMRFARSGFKNPEFYVATADNLPFQDSVFKLCLCVLSLNFIGNVEAVFEEVNRVLVSKGLLVCAVPVPERNKNQNNIRGVLYSQSKLESICRDKGFLFEPLPCENGSLLYFRALKQF